jgi:hypothetical protein
MDRASSEVAVNCQSNYDQGEQPVTYTKSFHKETHPLALACARASVTTNTHTHQVLLLILPSFHNSLNRPSLQSQPLFLRYGSSLPTSLIYIVLVTRGYEPWRPAADMGTVCDENYSLSRLFKG